MALEAVKKIKEESPAVEQEFLTLDPAESFQVVCNIQREIKSLTEEQQAMAKYIKELKERRDAILSGQITFAPHVVASDPERSAA